MSYQSEPVCVILKQTLTFDFHITGVIKCFLLGVFGSSLSDPIPTAHTGKHSSLSVMICALPGAHALEQREDQVAVSISAPKHHSLNFPALLF